MGNKYPIDYPFEELSECDSIYCKGNLSGYRYHVNHPVIRKLYETYKQEKGIPVRFAPSDRERQEFEYYVDKWLRKQA